MTCCLTAPSHCLNQSSVKSSDIHIRAISQEMPQPSITKIYLKITCLKFNSNFPGANELSFQDIFVLTASWTAGTSVNFPVFLLLQMCAPPKEKGQYPMFVFSRGRMCDASLNDSNPGPDRLLRVRHMDKKGRVKLKDSEDFVFLWPPWSVLYVGYRVILMSGSCFNVNTYTTFFFF